MPQKPNRSALAPHARLDVLAGMALFAGISRTDLAQLAALAQERRVARNDLVVRRGDPGDSLLVLVTGRLRASAVSPEGRELTHTVMDAGKVLGEIALLDGQARSLDVTATQDSLLLELHRSAFLPFLLARPELMLRLMVVLCERLRRSSAAFEDVALAPLPARLARLLLRLADEHGEPTPEGIRIRLKLTQGELSTQIAATREWVNKLFKQWRDQGWIDDSQPYLVLCRPDSLRALLGDASLA